jgi:hypothetical protein
MDVLGAILTTEGSLFKVLGLGFSVEGSGMRLKGYGAASVCECNLRNDLSDLRILLRSKS